MRTQILNSLSWTLKGMVARIVVALLLVLLALPVFYLGILGIYSLFWISFAITPSVVVVSLTPVFILLSAFGTLLSFRCALMTAGALAVFYLGWAFIVYPFSGLLPNSFIYWSWAIMLAILCVNLAWIVWSLRGRLALRAAA